MSKKIVLEPITRIEGHGKVTIYLNDGDEIEKVRFHVVEFRGFEKFCEGRLFWEMPVITPRICGICPVSHHLASVKAGDALLGVKIPPAARKLREMMQFAQYIQSHALHFFYLASPDLLLGMDANPAERNVIGLIEKYPELAAKGIRLRKFGQEILAILGDKKVHPNFAIPGGVNKALPPEARAQILKQVDGVIDDFKFAVDLIKDYLAQHPGQASGFARFSSNYMSLVNDNGGLELYDGKLRLKNEKGLVLEDNIDPQDYLSIIGERVEDWSYMKFPYYKKQGYPAGVYRVGPLARLNVANGISTPLANKEFQSYRKLSDGVIEGSLYYHYARMIEALYAAESIKALAEDDVISSTEIRVSSNKFNEEGVGIIEAPRGTLIHHYWIDPSGMIRKVNLIVATGHNNAAMNRAVEEVARGYVKDGKVTEGALNRVEAAIRCYDPCLSCATHSLGQMPLIIELVSPNGEVIHSLIAG
jgi:NAD-reducing hydrogenase large subunit